MTAVVNPFSITYGDREVGGATEFQLHGPYTIEKSYDTFRHVFTLVVTSDSFAGLQVLSDALETDFRKRLTKGDLLRIDLGGTAWEYTVGETLLRVGAQIQKTGNDETDHGFSRSYTVSIEGELPADQDAGLRDVEVLVERAAGGQRTVTMRGTYTATDAGDAQTRYEADFDSQAQQYLDKVKGSGSVTWELVHNEFNLDRQRDGDGGPPFPHVCNFTRQYVQLLADQSQGVRDDNQIRDHRLTFSDDDNQPGDSVAAIRRLRRVTGSFDCAVDIDQTTDLQAVYRNKITRFLKQQFQTLFTPALFCVEAMRASYDETSKRVSCTFQFLYQPSGGSAVVEVAISVAYRENRTIDYTPVHGTDEFAFYADVGWTIRQRVWDRVVMVLGQETPKTRIGTRPRAGAAGLFENTVGGVIGPDAGGDRSGVVADGWNIVSNMSQVTPQFIGDPDSTQLVGYRLQEQIIEQFHKKPAGRAQSPRGPTTPG